MAENISTPGKILEPKHKNFHEILFFVLTTVSTIGFSSSITTAFGWVSIAILLLISLGIIPSKAGQIVKYFSMWSDYATNRYKKIYKTPHIILTGNISVKTLKTFF